MSRPTRSRRHLQSLLRPRLEHLHLGFGVEGMRLVADRLGRIPHRQWRAMWSEQQGAVLTVDAASGSDDEKISGGGSDQGRRRRRGNARGGREAMMRRLLAGGPHDAGLGELLDQLADRLGWAGVQRAVLRERHVPERSAEWHDLLATPPGAASLLQADFAPDFEHADIPTRLLIPPEPIQVMALTPDGPVLRVRRIVAGVNKEMMCSGRRRWLSSAYLTSARSAGRTEDVEICTTYGPQRIGATWWLSRRLPDEVALHTRDYFKVQDVHGRWLWIFRDDRTHAWYLHGEWA